MGFYIQVPEPKNKAEQLVQLYDAMILPLQPEAFEDMPPEMALICVVDNGSFEAAGLVFDRDEFIDMIRPDEVGPVEQGRSGPGGMPVFTVQSDYERAGQQRPRTWVMMDKAKAHELAGYKE